MERRIIQSHSRRIHRQLLCVQGIASRKYVHSSKPQQSPSSTAASSIHEPIIPPAATAPTTPKSAVKASNLKDSPLAIIPTSAVLRTYLITGLSSSPVLLRLTISALQRMTASSSVLFNPEKNPLLRWLFKRTFYAQFCAGENKHEVQKTIEQVKGIGFAGVILEFALEVLDGEESTGANAAEELETWRKGMLETVDMTSPGDFVGLKWTGIGAEALRLLNADKPPTPAMQAAIHEACDLAAKKNVGILPGAELSHTNAGLDSWTLDLQRRYNKARAGHAIMYTTYQAYLKSAPARLARDLEIARSEGFTLGIKLVRGAYLASEPKSEVCASKEETDRQYDALMEAVIRRQYNDVLRPAAKSSSFPDVALMIASHNAPSVKRAIAIRNEQAPGERIECYFAQLQGMADEISCDLVQACRTAEAGGPEGSLVVDRPQAFKCATWGTMSECLHFLLRRAAENQDAAGRTAETRRAMGREMWRRWRSAFS